MHGSCADRVQERAYFTYPARRTYENAVRKVSVYSGVFSCPQSAFVTETVEMSYSAIAREWKQNCKVGDNVSRQKLYC